MSKPLSPDDLDCPDCGTKMKHKFTTTFWTRHDTYQCPKCGRWEMR